MARRLQSDRILFGAVVGLVLFGALMVFSASAVMAADKYHNGDYFLIRQLAWAAAGFAAVVLLMRLDYRRLNSPLVVFPSLAVVFILLVAVFFVDRSHNTHRWFHLGMASFQPSEFAKIALALFLAFFLNLRKGGINDWKHTLVPIVLIVGLMGALVLAEPDLGTAVALVMILAAMLFCAGMELYYFGLAGTCNAPPAVLADLPHRLPFQSHFGVPESLRGPSGQRVSHSSVVHCGGDRWHHRRGIDGRQAEALFPARAAHRFYFRGGGGGIGPSRLPGRGGRFCGHLVSRPAGQRGLSR